MALCALKGHEQIAVARQVPVSEGAVAKELEVPGFQSGIAIGPVIQHLHEHLDGGGVHPPRAEAIVDETRLEHRNIQPFCLMDSRKTVSRLPKRRRGDHHQVNLRQRMDVRILHWANGNRRVKSRTGACPEAPDGIVGDPEGQRAVHHFVRDGARRLWIGHVPDALDRLRSRDGPFDNAAWSRFGGPDEFLLRPPGHVR